MEVIIKNTKKEDKIEYPILMELKTGVKVVVLMIRENEGGIMEGIILDPPDFKVGKVKYGFSKEYWKPFEGEVILKN